jgi:hypothetical protein
LTQKGMKQERDLGLQLRKMYFNITEHYKSEEVLAYSMDSELSLASMFAFLSGLFEPTGYQVFDETVKWQPIPVYKANYKTEKVETRI